jgi:hypothetical protein
MIVSIVTLSLAATSRPRVEIRQLGVSTIDRGRRTASKCPKNHLALTASARKVARIVLIVPCSLATAPDTPAHGLSRDDVARG